MAPCIYIGQPVYSGAIPDSVRSIYRTATRNKYDTYAFQIGGSLLACSFNRLWCAALNRRSAPNMAATHFAMLHGDIEPELWWVDKLMEEMERVGCDVLSVVNAIKSDEGLTSTALPQDPDDPFIVERRLTMHEVMTLPETFTAADLGYPDRALLVNTGCWLARIDQPWVEQVHFEIHDKIVKLDNGVFMPLVEPEDWNFSRQLHRLGVKVAATRKVKCLHEGARRYPNFEAWGEWQFDHNSPLLKGRPEFAETLPEVNPEAPMGISDEFAESEPIPI